MLVVAGLPVATHNRAVGLLRDRFPLAQVVGQTSPTKDGRLYPAKGCGDLLRTVCEFTLRKRTKGPDRPPAPSAITLFYVPAGDEETLLRAFDFAVMPVPLTALALRDGRSRQLRHSIEAVEQSLADAAVADGAARAALHEVQQRLDRLSEEDALLLPPRNFWTRDGRLADTFKEFRRGGRPWNDRLKSLGPTTLGHGNVARIAEGTTRSAFVDARGFAFFLAHPTAFHALPRDGEADARGEAERILRALYRFGGTLAPGLHHDVQPKAGARLEEVEFECSRDGPVTVKDDYANIYPNDFVRAAGKKKIKRRDLNIGRDAVIS